jgi:coenzyme F420 hydrogenase subunit beta
MSGLERVLRGRLCVGCGLCASLAPNGITMVMSSEGFLRPAFDGRLSESVDRQVSEACPGLVVERDYSDGKEHPIWGTVKNVRIGFAADPDVQFQGSSGGAITAIAASLVERRVVDFVVHVAADDKNAILNRTVVSRSRDEMLRGSGSRYGPSAPLENILGLLGSNVGHAAFIGKPCDVAAIRAYARTHASVGTRIKVYLSFFCAGVPSIRGTERILSVLGANPEDVAEFRYRGKGWPGNAAATLRDGRRLEMSYAASWGEILNKHLQFRCKICPDGTGELADIVCADAWYGEDGYPDFTERDGRSLIISRSDLGEQVVADAIMMGALRAEPVNLDCVERMQPYQVARKQGVLGRLLALRVLLRPTPRYRGLRLVRAAWRGGLIQSLRNFGGTAVRIVAGKRR